MTQRSGPRPLPLLMAAEAMTWLASSSAWLTSKDGLPSLKGSDPKVLQDLSKRLVNVDPLEFNQAVLAAARRRFERFQAGVAGYQAAPLPDRPTDMPVVWQAGTTRLLDYATPTTPKDAPAVLVIPSLINRYRILDLSENHSLLRSLNEYGVRPFVIDWQAPGTEETVFDLSAYATERLVPALDQVTALTGQKPSLLGYCMGGLLALSLAALRPDDVSRLALLATPWDFHTGPEVERLALGNLLNLLSPLMTSLGHLPEDVLQTLFWARAPFLAGEKFRAFAGLNPESARSEAFVRLEDWLNDGVPLAAPVAENCFRGWYLENQPLRDKWAVAGTPVKPGNLPHLALIMVPDQDHIVPPESALPLADLMPNATLKRLKAGHIGMVAGGRAKTNTFRPLSSWLNVPITKT